MKVMEEAIIPFLRPSPHRADRQAPYLSLHQPVSHCSPHPGDLLRPHPTESACSPRPFPAAFPYKWPLLPHASDFPNFSQTRSIQPLHIPYLLLNSPRPRIRGSRPWFTVWPLLGTSKPSTSLFGMAPGRASAPSGQLQTMPDHSPTISTSDTLKGQTW